MTAYYNEFDPAAADWIEALIEDGLLPAGKVDRRSIADVEAQDLDGFAQHHFFAGIGGWPFALRLIGWPDDRPVWTGSCPCPPFSAAGKGSECPSCGGKANLAHPLVTAGWLCLSCGDEWRGDDRHLLPEFIRLIGQRRPAVVFGEQVASADGRSWFAALRAVVERVGYGAGAADLCAAGVGAPHIRQRLFFGLADATGSRHVRAITDTDTEGDPRDEARMLVLGSERTDGRLADRPRVGRGEERALGRRRSEGDGPEGWATGHDAGGDAGRMADRSEPRLEGHGGHGRGGDEPGRLGAHATGSTASRGDDGGLADAHGGDARAEWEQRSREQRQQSQDGGTGWLADTRCSDDECQRRPIEASGASRPAQGKAQQLEWSGLADRPSSAPDRPRSHHIGWSDPDWLFCRDGKWRPVESSVLGLADGLPDGVVSGSYPLAQTQAARQARLRGFGNAIVPQLAAEFMTSFMESIDD